MNDGRIDRTADAGDPDETGRWERAVRSRDARFDGWFFLGVVTTGIYCRPSCPAAPPKSENMRFFRSAAAAQQAGFRACKRCRPDASPGSPRWNERADLVSRAMRLIIDGVVDRDGVPGLARRLDYSARQIERHLVAEVGAGPLAIARAQRAQTARLLIETTTLPMGDVAGAAGFGSIRTFNDTVREVFASSPSELRRLAARRAPVREVEPEVCVPGRDGETRPATPSGKLPGPSGPSGRSHGPRRELRGGLSLRLPFRKPLCPDNLFGHLVATAVPGVEEWRDGAYRRTLRLPHGYGIVALRPEVDHIACRLTLTDMRDLTTAVSRCRRLLDLDADPIAVDTLLGADPQLAELVAKAPGRRVPRTVDPAEFAVRAVLGQQVSTAAARTHAARLVALYGQPIGDPDGGDPESGGPDGGDPESRDPESRDPGGGRRGGLTHLFPSPQDLLGLDPDRLAMPRARRDTLLHLVRALAAGEIDLDVGADWSSVRGQLADLPGFGPWTTETVAMRALGDPDAFAAGDLGVRAGARRLGLPSSPAALTAHAAAWRPWRAYAVQYLWASGDHPINSLPPSSAAHPRARRALNRKANQ